MKHLGNTSGKYHVNSGVPQGSNLGPLLFVLFVNDLSQCVSFSDFLLFADDFKMFRKIQTVRDCVLLQRDINNIHKWSIDNQLKFNINKCSVMSVSRKKECIIFDYQIEKDTLCRLQEIKDLVVTYDNKLSYASHISKSVASANRMLGFIWRQTYFFSDINTISVLYNILVRPKLDFASLI